MSIKQDISGQNDKFIWCNKQNIVSNMLDVEYRFGKLLLFIIPFIICFTVGIAIWVSLVYDIISGAVSFTNAQWGGLCVTAIFWIFGLVGMMFRSKKERVLVEEHLLRICNIKS